MEIRPYVDLIIEKFDKANGYTEIDKKILRSTIAKYLEDIYDEEIENLCTRLEINSDGDLLLDTGVYNRELLKIKSIVLRKSQELSKSNKD